MWPNSGSGTGATVRKSIDALEKCPVGGRGAGSLLPKPHNTCFVWPCIKKREITLSHKGLRVLCYVCAGSKAASVAAGLTYPIRPWVYARM